MNFIENTQPNQTIKSYDSLGLKEGISHHKGHTYQLVTLNETGGQIHIGKLILAVIKAILSIVIKEWRESSQKEIREALGTRDVQVFLNVDALPDNIQKIVKSTALGEPKKLALPVKTTSPSDIPADHLTQIGAVDLKQMAYIKLNDHYFALNVSVLNSSEFLKTVVDFSELSPLQVIDLSENPSLKPMPPKILEKILSQLAGVKTTHEKEELPDLLHWSNYLAAEGYYLILRKEVEKDLTPEKIAAYASQKPAMQLAIRQIMSIKMKSEESTEMTKIIKDNILNYSLVFFDQHFGGSGACINGWVNPKTGELSFKDQKEGMVHCLAASGPRSFHKMAYNKLSGHTCETRPVGIVLGDGNRHEENRRLFTGSPEAEHAVKMFEKLMAKHWDKFQKLQGICFESLQAKEAYFVEHVTAIVEKIDIVSPSDQALIEAYKKVA